MHSLAIVIIGAIFSWWLSRISIKQDQLADAIRKGLISNERLEVWKDEHDKKDNGRHEEMMRSLHMLNSALGDSSNNHLKFFHSRNREEAQQ